MILYQKLKKLNIDYSAIELEPHGMKGSFFPKNTMGFSVPYPLTKHLPSVR